MRTFREYQFKALETLKDSANNAPYAILGMIGEAGEIANKVKKIIRDDGGKPTGERKAAIFGELGDVFWYVAIYCYVFALDIDKIMGYRTIDMLAEDGKYNISGINSATVFLNINVGKVAEHGFDIKREVSDHERNEALCRIIMYIAIIAKMCGYSLMEVLQHNIEKLADRKKRNAIGGSGDNR